MKTVRAPEEPAIMVFMAAIPRMAPRPSETPNVEPALKNTQQVHN